MRRIWLLCLLLAVSSARAAGGIDGGWSAAPARTGDICADALIDAARRHGVPQRWALAIGITEAGQQRGNRLRIWPWTLNIAGEGRYFTSREAARQAFEGALAAGMTSIDAGCAQINWHWHGARFTAPDDLLDPQRNADYAMRYLAGHYRRSGDWGVAVARYHSATGRLGGAYLRRVTANQSALEGLADGGPIPAGAGGIAAWARLDAMRFTLPEFMLSP